MVAGSQISDIMPEICSMDQLYVPHRCFIYIILVAISSIEWSNPGTLLNHFFRHYKMEKKNRVEQATSL